MTKNNDKDYMLCDGNMAAANIAYKFSDISIIYPITPSSPMGELADAWSAKGKSNLFGNVVDVSMMQSEAGAIGAVHGALQMGTNATTFTASQGLLLMIPNMYKIAGELTPFVMHVAARTIATHALSIFGDHSDVMACRQTGFAMLASNSVQEAQDMAVVSHVATLKSRVPFLHFFDGFRTSHEITKIEKVSDEVLNEMLDMDDIEAKYNRGLTPENPGVRGTAQNPDVFFQAREASNPFYNEVPAIVQETMDKYAKLTGRKYNLVDYYGAKDAQKVIVAMGSACDITEESIDFMNANGEKVGLIKIRLYRPFPSKEFIKALPKTVKKIAVLDRTKESGSVGEPLYLDVISTLMEEKVTMDVVIGGRYGLSSKDFTPACVKAIYDELDAKSPKREFTVGINDDLTHLSLKLDNNFTLDSKDGNYEAMFFGLGSDGTVGANKNSVKIISEESGKYGQAYFVYDSKKAGATTVSHLRFSDEKIKSSYLIKQADFVACHHFPILHNMDILDSAKQGAIFLINSPFKQEALWENLPKEAQQTIIDKKLKLYAINASNVARDAGMGRRINTVMQVCFFKLSNVIDYDKAISLLKDAVKDTYSKKGDAIVERNIAAIDNAEKNLYEVKVPSSVDSKYEIANIIPEDATLSQKMKVIINEITKGKGDDLPVSAFTADGSFESGTTKYEKRSLAAEVPVWDPEVCIQCSKCTMVCPHAAIRSKAVHDSELVNLNKDFKYFKYKTPELGENMNYIIQVSPRDCTGCTLCVDACPALNRETGKKAINMTPIEDVIEQEEANWNTFEKLPYIERERLNPALPKHSQLMQPLFEYSGACAGCGETPYIKLLTQLYGDRMVIANATGCSSIYGGNLPTTPYAKNAQGNGPAWSNSLFEDNAEYGLGMKIAIDKQNKSARELIVDLKDELPADLVANLLKPMETDNKGVAERRKEIDKLKQIISKINTPKAKRLMALADYLLEKSMWILGGDGWAYDIGYAGIDHLLYSGKNVNIFVLDTEAYSNTGGQMSKSTPKGAVAKFASGGKEGTKKDLGRIAMVAGNVYVAKVAIGANDMQTLKAIREAESFDGPSLIIGYSPCVAHGYDLSDQLNHQKDAVNSGHWMLYRYDPRLKEVGKNPFQKDSALKEGYRETFDKYIKSENRYKSLEVNEPDKFEKLSSQAKDQISEKHSMFDLNKKD